MTSQTLIQSHEPLLTTPALNIHQAHIYQPPHDSHLLIHLNMNLVLYSIVVVMTLTTYATSIIFFLFLLLLPSLTPKHASLAAYKPPLLCLPLLPLLFCPFGSRIRIFLGASFLWKRQAAARGLLVLVWWYDGFLFAGGGCCCWLWWFISMIIRCLFCRCCEVLRLLCCGVSGVGLAVTMQLVACATIGVVVSTTVVVSS